MPVRRKPPRSREDPAAAGAGADTGHLHPYVVLMARVTPAATWLCDLDGVLIRDDRAIDGAREFLQRLTASGRPHLILTNNSMFTPGQLRERLDGMGLCVDESKLWTSALATARFLAGQRPGGRAFVIGEASLHEALSDVGYALDDQEPDYVVLGETQVYAFDEITTAIRLVERGARLVATNPEPTGPSPAGPLPACGAVAALVERATRVAPYFVGKPNPLMITEAMAALDARPGSTALVGDRMETDVAAGVGAGLETILVLSGVATSEDLGRYAFRPTRVVGSVADLVDEL
jgi:NagD protein